jgi:aldose 1-epimerase
MSVKKQRFGQTRDGREITIYTIDNGIISAQVTDFGANLVSLLVPDVKGTVQDIILGYDRAEGYLDNGCFFGSLIVPIANRTGKASFVLDGQRVDLPVNDGPNNLHTDFENGSHKRLWKALTGENFVTFMLEMAEGDLGLPGNKNITVTYSVTDQNALSIHYHVTSDRHMIINPTNHAYFNLNGHNSGSIEGQELMLNAHAFTPVGAGSIPTGEIRSVEGTPLDFTVSKPIGRDINAEDEQLGLVGGYDHNFVIDGWSGNGDMLHAATAFSGQSGRRMDVYTNLPGVQFYAGNFIECGIGEGKEHSTYGKRSAFCLETQYYPDSIHHDNFPDYVFGENRVYDSTTAYCFSIRQEN